MEHFDPRAFRLPLETDIKGRLDQASTGGHLKPLAARGRSVSRVIEVLAICWQGPKERADLVIQACRYVKLIKLEISLLVIFLSRHFRMRGSSHLRKTRIDRKVLGLRKTRTLR